MISDAKACFAESVERFIRSDPFGSPLRSDLITAFRRLASDERMRGVWEEFHADGRSAYTFLFWLHKIAVVVADVKECRAIRDGLPRELYAVSQAVGVLIGFWERCEQRTRWGEPDALPLPSRFESLPAMLRDFEEFARASIQTRRPLPAAHPRGRGGFYPAPRQAQSTEISLGYAASGAATVQGGRGRAGQQNGSYRLGANDQRQDLSICLVCGSVRRSLPM